MSDDIVKRLLMSCGPATERAAKLAAADEIERLRAELAAAIQARDEAIEVRDATKAGANINRVAMQKAIELAQKARAENTKLREALERAKYWLPAPSKVVANTELHTVHAAIDAVLKEVGGGNE
jgi:hypothetical protein